MDPPSSFFSEQQSKLHCSTNLQAMWAVRELHTDAWCHWFVLNGSGWSGSQLLPLVGHIYCHHKNAWRRKWQPTPEFLLENPRDGGAWWAAVYGGTQSQTRLKWLSSSSSIRMAPWQTSLIVTFSTLKPTDSPGRASLMVHSKGLDFICITAWSQVTTMLGVENSSLHGDSTSSINFIDVLEGQTEGLVSRISW